MNLERAAALTMALWGATTVLTVSWAPAVDAGGGGCNGANPQTCHAGVGIPATKRGPIDLSGKVAAAVASRPATCHNVFTPDVEVLIQVADWGTGPPWPMLDGRYDNFDPGPPDHPGQHYYVHYCPGMNQENNSINWRGGGWGDTTPDPPPPTPAQVRDALWNEVKGTLVNPTPALDPLPGIRSTLKVPTFVAIGNPQVSTLYTATVQGVYVWLAVVPTATLHPGEPGAPAVPCDEDGTTFDPGGAEADQQAEAANGCVYTYERHGAGWGGDVTISWYVPWGSNQAGENGTLDAADNVGAFVRIVDELQGLNVPGDAGGGDG